MRNLQRGSSALGGKCFWPRGGSAWGFWFPASCLSQVALLWSGPGDKSMYYLLSQLLLREFGGSASKAASLWGKGCPSSLFCTLDFVKACMCIRRRNSSPLLVVGGVWGPKSGLSKVYHTLFLNLTLSNVVRRIWGSCRSFCSFSPLLNLAEPHGPCSKASMKTRLS